MFIYSRIIIFSGDETPTFNWNDLDDRYETVGEVAGVNLWSSTFSAAEITDAYENCPSVSSLAITTFKV